MTILVEGERSFFINTPAIIINDLKDVASNWASSHIYANDAIKWVLAKYVEADQANSNGQMWALEDLRLKFPTVNNSPMNIDHHQHEIVGTWAASELLYPTEEQSSQFNPYVEVLGAFWRAYFPEVFQAVEEAFNTGMLSCCVDDQTEILTVDGWTTYDKIGPGTIILTMNKETMQSEWMPINKVFTYDVVDRDMHLLESETHSSLTTPNHRWWIKHRYENNPKLRENPYVLEERTTDQLSTTCGIPMAIPHGQYPEIAKYSDDVVALMGWGWTDGTITRPNSGSPHISFFQSESANSHKCAQIRSHLRNLYGKPSKVSEGGLWYETIRTSPYEPGRNIVKNPFTQDEKESWEGEWHDDIVFHLNAQASAPFMDLVDINDSKFMPSMSFLLNLTQSQLSLFIEASILADGTIAKSDGQTVFYQKGSVRADFFVTACALAGIPVNKTLCFNSDNDEDFDIWRVCIIRRGDYTYPVRNAMLAKNRDWETKSPAKNEIIKYTGKIWCPNSDNETFLARRRGTVYWTMNSMECSGDSVTCSGTEVACGETFDYLGPFSDTYCSHIKERASHRQINNPHFLGGALIMPPNKPGWKSAHVTEMSDLTTNEDADQMMEKLEEQHPNGSEQQWRSMMNSIVYRAALGKFSKVS